MVTEEEIMNTNLQGVQSKMGLEQLQQQQQARLIDEQGKGLVKEQLDLSEEFEKIDHLLRGHIQMRDESGDLDWFEPRSNENVLLTEAGINLVLNTIAWYLTKNTLLSNYSEDIINKKMEDFANALNDNLFMRYEIYFLYPTPDECQQNLINRLKKKQQNLIYSAELRGESIDSKKTWNKLVNEIDPDLERAKIREHLIKDKLKGFDLLMREIQDIIHSAYLRALNAQERKTLRQHWHITESMGGNIPPKKESKGLGWFRRK